MDFPALATYLAELDANNNKAWFEANRPRYDKLRADFADLVEEVLFGVAAFDQRVQGLQAKDCLYRIYRDVRFSKDKTPYKTTFSASFPRNMTGAGYYFQLDHEGKLMVALAHAEAGSRFDLKAVKDTTAKKSGDSYSINGVKTLALSAPSAGRGR